MRMSSRLAGVLGGLAMLATPLSAQEKALTFNVGGAYMGTLGDVQKVTAQDSAYQVSLGFTTHLYKTDVPFRVTLSDNMLQGKTHGVTGIKSSLNGIQLAGDVLINSGVENLSFVTGLSINKWSLSNKGTEPAGGYLAFDPSQNVVSSSDPTGNPTYDPIRNNPNNFFNLNEDKGIKFGARLGLEYRFSEHWTTDLLAQIIEVGTSAKNANGDSIRGGINASWVQLGVKYHF